MGFENSLSQVNNGLSTTLQGYRTAKVGLSDTKNLVLLVGGLLVGLILLKKKSG